MELTNALGFDLKKEQLDALSSNGVYTGEMFAEALAMPVSTDEEKEAKIAAVKKLYEELGIEEEAKKEIMHFHNLAMESAEALNLGKFKFEMLHRYAEMLLGRRK